MKMRKSAVLVLAAGSSLFALADNDEGPGIHIGKRLTLHPYVSFRYMYDSNVDSERHGDDGSCWTINPGVNIDFDNDGNLGRWKVSMSVYFNANAFTGSRSTDNHRRMGYGESVALTWDGQNTWEAMISESYSKSLQSDDMMESDGKGIGRDRGTLSANAMVGKRFNERLHANVNVGISDIDYTNDRNEYSPLYGWSGLNTSASLGYTVSQWADLFVSGHYSWHRQQNCDDLHGERGTPIGRDIGKYSHGYGVHVGFGSMLNERVNYSLSGGWSGYEYGGVDTSNGFTYNGSLSWQMAETWRMTGALSGNFQPSEREYGSSVRYDSVMLNVSHQMIRGKLNAYVDLVYRREDHNIVEYTASDYHQDVFTTRVGANYSINRYLSCFAHYGYQTSTNNGGRDNNAWDYNRMQWQFGLTLRY